MAMAVEVSDADSEMSDCASEEADEYEDTAAEELKEGKVSVRNRNGELWCPFCAGKKKNQYKYAELVQHATGVSKGKRGVEAAGRHRALLKYLNAHMSHMEEPPKERLLRLEQDTPVSEMAPKDEKLVWPWMGIIVNIDNSKMVDNKRVGPGNGELKKQFARFRPKDVQTKWNFHGHQGVAVAEFESDMIGYGDAQDFERSFMESGRGRREWERSLASFEGPGNELYGWIANQHDYSKDDLIGKHLRDKGNLRTVAEVNEARLRQTDQLLQNLDATIQDQNQKLQDSTRQVFGLQSLVRQTEKARQEAEQQKNHMEQRHKQELLAVEEEAKKIIQLHEYQMRKEREKLDGEFRNLQIHCNLLERQEVHNDVERRIKEREISENEKKMQKFMQIQKLHENQEAKKIMLIKKQEGESNNLLQGQYKQQKLLLQQHKLEQEIQALEAILEAKSLEANENKQTSSNMRDMEQKLDTLRSEKELLEDINQKLLYKERELNDEVQNARKTAVKVLEKKGSKKLIGVKKMGELDQAPWKLACKHKFKNDPDGWELKCKLELTTWEENLSNVQWHPFKVVQVGEMHEERINEQDDKLAGLRREYGEAVYVAVVNALKELQEYNASGRYLISVPWNYAKNKKATLEEIIEFLAMEKAPPKKRSRRA